MYEMVTEHFTNRNLSVVVVKCWILGFVVWEITFISSVFTTTLTLWPDFWLFTNINGCCTGSGCLSLFPVCGWFEWPSSGVVGFYDHELWWSCSLWLRNCLLLRSVGCRPDPYTWWNAWPDEWCSWHIVWVAAVALIGNLDHSSLLVVISMVQTV